MKLRDSAQFCCAFHLAWCFMKETDIGCFVFSTSSDFRPREPMECCPFRSPIAYRKIPKISPGAYIFQRPCLRGLFLEGLIFGGAYVRREICVSKSIGLACNGKEIYHFSFVAFDEGRTLPNLLGCLLSRRCPVHASES